MSRQSCRRNLIRLRLIRSYTMRELADVLGVHARTVQEWHKQGLMAIDEADRPLLFLGAVVKNFLGIRKRATQCKLKSDQCYCLRCRIGVKPDDSTVSVEVTSRRIGMASRQVIVKGICPVCQATVVRFASTKSIQNTPWGADLTREQLKIDMYSQLLPKH